MSTTTDHACAVEVAIRVRTPLVRFASGVDVALGCTTVLVSGLLVTGESAAELSGGVDAPACTDAVATNAETATASRLVRRFGAGMEGFSTACPDEFSRFARMSPVSLVRIVGC